MKPDSLCIVEHRPMGRDAFLLRLERPAWTWKAGQVVGLCGKNSQDQRDYSIASGPDDETLDVLYRLIPHGIVTPHLRAQNVGDRLQVVGPYGRFTLRSTEHPLLLCATGTGIAPFRAFTRSHPTLCPTLLHGVRFPEDLYFREEFSGLDYHPFCSREALDGFTGRLSDALREIPLQENLRVYLCGANEMIYEAEEILLGRGIPKTVLFQEPYYYRAYDD